MLKHDPANTFARLESNVRSYCRSMPAVFKTARGSELWDVAGKRFIDFWSACGSLNFGHNHPQIKEAVLRYVSDDGIIAGVDLHTVAKSKFLDNFAAAIIEPLRADYVVQFTGPTGTNTVEASIKLARKITGRSGIVAFTNAFHGMSLGALSLTGNKSARNCSVGALGNVVRLPYDGYNGAGIAELERYDSMVRDPSGGCEAPAAYIVEVVQGEGGLNAARPQWLKALQKVAYEQGALFIVDEVQTGCGRTGPFFAFEEAGIAPDLVCVAKSIGGIGAPMSLLLIRREYDQWSPGEHNGTFRGNNLAFVAANAALDLWQDAGFQEQSHRLSSMLGTWCSNIARIAGARVRGRGAMRGLAFQDPEIASKVKRRAYKLGLLVECCGPLGEVLKIMPPLTTTTKLMEEGLSLLTDSILDQTPMLPVKGSGAGHVTEGESNGIPQ